AVRKGMRSACTPSIPHSATWTWNFIVSANCTSSKDTYIITFKQYETGRPAGYKNPIHHVFRYSRTDGHGGIHPGRATEQDVYDAQRNRRSAEDRPEHL